MKSLIVTLVITCFMLLNAQSNESYFASIYDTNKHIVSKDNYFFKADWVFNNGKREFLNSNYSLELNDEKTTFYLRDLKNSGKVYSKTNQKITNYKVITDDAKQTVFITFNADTFVVTIRLAKNGNAFVTLSTNTDSITYIGTIKEIDN